MCRIFHPSKKIKISYKEQDIAGRWYIKMESRFTLPIVTCHLIATLLGQWYFIVNWISFMTP